MCTLIRTHFYHPLFQVEKLAQGFLTLGLQPGDRIGVLGPNSLSWVLTQLAAAYAGIILVSNHFVLICFINLLG